MLLLMRSNIRMASHVAIVNMNANRMRFGYARRAETVYTT